MLCSSSSDEVSPQHLLKAKRRWARDQISRHMVRLACLRVRRWRFVTAAAEPQRRQKDSDEPAGRRANWRAHRKAWAVRRRGRCWRNPQALGAREQGPASLSECLEKGECAWGSLGQHLTAKPVGEPPN